MFDSDSHDLGLWRSPQEVPESPLQTPAQHRRLGKRCAGQRPSRSLGVGNTLGTLGQWETLSPHNGPTVHRTAGPLSPYDWRPCPNLGSSSPG
jgi:hypothetical protein